ERKIWAQPFGTGRTTAETATAYRQTFSAGNGTGANEKRTGGSGTADRHQDTGKPVEAATGRCTPGGAGGRNTHHSNNRKKIKWAHCYGGSRTGGGTGGGTSTQQDADITL